MFYDVTKTYEYNYEHGPFLGELPKLPKGPGGELFGHPLDIPFGIPAGPLINGKFIEAAWQWGYSIATYKTVRSLKHPCHPMPNTMRYPPSMDWTGFDVHQDGIINSYGVPSQEPTVWQRDVADTLIHTPRGSILILSFMGTGNYVKACKLANDTGAPILEVNLSCPNVSGHVVSEDPDATADVLEELHSVKGNVPLLVKIGYIEDDDALCAIAEAVHRYADGVTAINSIKTGVGKQVFPGRLKAGISGAPIRPYALSMIERLDTLRELTGHFVIVGVGGVTSAEDYVAFRQAGADAVLSATGAIWHPELAQQVRYVQ